MAHVPVFDGHNDTLINLHLAERGKGRSFFNKSDVGHLDLPKAKEGGLIGGIFAIFTLPPEGSKERDPYYGLTISEEGYEVSPRSPIAHGYAKEFSNAVLSRLSDLIAQSDGQVRLVRSAEELENCLQAGIFSLVLAFEGAAAICKNLSDLESYYERGLRVLGLTWSRPNAFACGVPFRFPHSPDTGPGLTNAGKNLVRACNQLGILLDLAHINERGFWDVAALSNAPLVVSHAGVHALCPSTRNLTDEQIDAVGESNGLIGVIFEPSNIAADGHPDADMPVREIVRHVDYVVERIGIDHVAFGSDFDGADMPREIGDASGIQKLVQALREAGYDDEALCKIANQNWVRVFKDSWKT